ncbi:hypothetical protein M8C21_017069 [Ambrosia artemisiifolia]|uniref:Uncharacterized protein n=1 Tax=Ambrosia artemisiifolia TaxID=4212 RepID=A0AAD5GCV8_AMBAR|nr:hypothetical protein M8C21_017069 [Ambrosia artemisiifolia]
MQSESIPKMEIQALMIPSLLWLVVYLDQTRYLHSTVLRLNNYKFALMQ